MDTPFPMTGSNAEYQRRFDQLYISSTDICQRLGVSRVQLFSRKKRGDLPGAVVVNGAQITLWERAKIEPHLQEWETEIEKRKSRASMI